MNYNPNKPRLLRNEGQKVSEKNTAESFFDMTGESRVSVSPLTEMTTSEQAGVLFTNAKTRDELLATLHSKHKE